MYVVEMNVYWGYSNDSLMHEYEAYTITCSTEGLATNNTVPERTIDDKFVTSIFIRIAHIYIIEKTVHIYTLL